MYIILRLWSWTPISICQSIINLSSATCKLFWLFISGHAIYEYLQDTYLINFRRKNFKILKLFLQMAKFSQRRPFNFTLLKIQKLICNLVKGRVSWHLNELTWVSNLILNWRVLPSELITQYGSKSSVVVNRLQVFIDTSSQTFVAALPVLRWLLENPPLSTQNMLYSW